MYSVNSLYSCHLSKKKIKKIIASKSGDVDGQAVTKRRLTDSEALKCEMYGRVLGEYIWIKVPFDWVQL